MNHDALKLMWKRLAQGFIGRENTTSDVIANPSPAFATLMIERLYYAEGRHHPDHPRHGSQSGLSWW